MKRYILMFAIAIILFGCNTIKVQQFASIDDNEKTICMPPGNQGLMGDIKNALRKDGWTIKAINKSKRETQGSEQASGDVVMTIHESQIIELSRYRLYFDCSHANSGNTSWPELSIIDNRSGEEVILISDEGWASNEDLTNCLMSAIHGCCEKTRK